MKRKVFTTVIFLVFGAFLVAAAAQEQAAQPAAPSVADIRNAIVLAPHYGVFDNLSFELDGGSVTLLGQVLLPITGEEASKRIAKLAGVAKVINRIEALPVSDSDDALRLRVYRSLFGTSDLYRYALSPNPSIHIIVKGGHVKLAGVVSSEGDSRFAYMAARKVNGTFSVTNNLEVEK
jgi:osmotically-inducible protein OsmY